MRSHRPGRARRGPWPGLLAGVAIGLAAAPALAQPASPANPPAPADAPRGPAPHIAVFGFAVQSAEADPELGGRLARELVAILAEDRRVAVVDESVRREPPEPAPGETRDAALRRAGAELGADYTVTGRATQLVRGGSIDLAVRLTGRDPGAISDTQVLTARSVAELTSRLSEIAERIIGQVAGAPPARVVSVEITGAPGFEEQLLGRLTTRAGEPYDPRAVHSDLATLRSSAAILSAEARTERTTAGVAVHFAVREARLLVVLDHAKRHAVAKRVGRGLEQLLVRLAQPADGEV